MSRINPIKIDRPEPYLLQAEWADGKKSNNISGDVPSRMSLCILQRRESRK